MGSETERKAANAEAITQQVTTVGSWSCPARDFWEPVQNSHLRGVLCHGRIEHLPHSHPTQGRIYTPASISHWLRAAPWGTLAL